MDKNKERFSTTELNRDLRRLIVEMVYKGKDGHIPSAFSIIDVISFLYDDFLRFDPENPGWEGRDYFILSKGHGCLALYANLFKHGFISRRDIELFCMPGGILGEHPDSTKIPGVEASTGSLGHGFPFSMGIALGQRIKGGDNRIVALIGDGECQEGTIWETALVAAYRKLGNLCCIVDLNGSAEQILPLGDLKAKWEAFGWEAHEIDGHSQEELRRVFGKLQFASEGRPKVVIAHTVKGKGVPMIEGHGVWHHRIPSEQEYGHLMQVLSDESR